MAALPADGHCQRLGGAGTRTDDLGPQPSGLEDIEERITGGYGPCVRQREPWGNWRAGREGPNDPRAPGHRDIRSLVGVGGGFHGNHDASGNHQQVEWDTLGAGLRFAPALFLSADSRPAPASPHLLCRVAGDRGAIPGRAPSRRGPGAREHLQLEGLGAAGWPRNPHRAAHARSPRCPLLLPYSPRLI